MREEFLKDRDAAFGRSEIIETEFQEPFARIVFRAGMRVQGFHIREPKSDADLGEDGSLGHSGPLNSATRQHNMPLRHAAGTLGLAQNRGAVERRGPAAAAPIPRYACSGAESEPILKHQ